MATITTSVFKNNQSQAVRLPKALELEDGMKQVLITAIGKTRIITPVESGWDEWFFSKNSSDDFMNTRDQETDQLRDSI